MSNLAAFPTDNLDYGFDWSKFLGTDTILTALITATPSGLTVGSTTFSSNVVKAKITGGTVNTSYRINCYVTTAAGNSVNSEFYLDIRDAR